MSIDNAIRNRDSLLTTIGKTALNIKFPKEFEVYVCAFELVDGAGRTLRYFIFPVMPSSIREREPESTNIRRTLGGVTALNSTTFVPVDIMLAGTFGRKFKILLGTDYVEFLNAFKTVDGKVTLDSAAKGTIGVFDDRIKTGYGCLQVLKDIIEEAGVVDANGSRRLIFYNPAFGTSYVVKVMEKTIDMAQESNMLHNYSVTMKGIAPLDALKTQSELESDATKLNITDYMQKRTNNLVNALTSIIQ
jgi:hypothetical protein